MKSPGERRPFAGGASWNLARESGCRESSPPRSAAGLCRATGTTALHLCKRNGERNDPAAIEYRLADWTEWDDPGRYDWIIGSDILYGDSLHPHLRRIFESNLAPEGRILLADPFRGRGLRFLETLEAEGWCVTFSKWDIGEEPTPRPLGVFELSPPGSCTDNVKSR